MVDHSPPSVWLMVFFLCAYRIDFKTICYVMYFIYRRLLINVQDIVQYYYRKILYAGHIWCIQTAAYAPYLSGSQIVLYIQTVTFFAILPSP